MDILLTEKIAGGKHRHEIITLNKETLKLMRVDSSHYREYKRTTK